LLLYVRVLKVFALYKISPMTFILVEIIIPVIVNQFENYMVLNEAIISPKKD